VNATDLDILRNALITFIIGPGGRDNFGVDPNDGHVFVSPNPRLVVDRPPTHYNVTVRLRACSRTTTTTTTTTTTRQS